MNHIRNIAAAAVLALSACLAPAGTPTWQNGRIQYDSQCMTIDGKDVVIFSGAFHYFRCPKELWADRFKKLKEAGFNTVETYAAWNYHEQNPPRNVDDFSQCDTSEIDAWLKMAIDQFGFNVIFRPGPYICAEWDGGGYPQWLLNKRPMSYKKKEWFRSDDPTYLAWCKHWYAACAKVAVPYQITHRPAGSAGIIEWQIENEYDFSSQPVDVKLKQLVYLAHTSRELGIDVPLMTCVTNHKVFHEDPYFRENVIQTANSYAGFNMAGLGHEIDSLKGQPEKFKAVTELQGGWFAQVGGKLSEQQGFDETQINQITIYAWEHGVTSTNYYMGFGGSNMGDWAALKLTQTYDYDAPIRESGGVTARYQAVKALGQFIAEHGPELARSVPTAPALKAVDFNEGTHFTLRTVPDGARFLFVRSDNRKAISTGKLVSQAADGGPIQCEFDLGNFGAKILYLPKGSTSDKDGGVWYPKPQPEIQRPATLPAATTVKFKSMVDETPTTWTPMSPDQTETAAGVYNRRYVYYRAKLLNVPADKPLTFTTGLSGEDWAALLVDGKRIVPTAGRMFTLPAGTTEVTILYDNAGRPNFGGGLETPSGLLDPKVYVPSGTAVPLSEWKQKKSDRKPADGDVAETVDTAGWTDADVTTEDGDLAPNSWAVYRTTLDIKSENVLKHGWMLTAGRIDDQGTIFVNGVQVGECDDWSSAQQFDVTSHLHAGVNTFAVRVHNREGAGGLSKGVSLDPIGDPVESRWEISQQSAAVVGRWWENSFDDSKWGNPNLDKAKNVLTPLPVWYRSNFELPTPDPKTWVPWRLNLDAVGNGYVYVNGHCLGRYWEVGPQHHFYLPECWLNFGPGKANNITIELRPGKAEPAIQSAAVEPIAREAEFR